MTANLTEKQKTLANKLASLFLINGKPANEEMSEGQMLIFSAIVFKLNPRIASLAPTGYGKSEAISMGVIVRTCLMGDAFIVASVKLGTSDIIMSKVNEHLFDNNIFITQLEFNSEEDFDRLRRKRTQSHLTFKNGGELQIVSLHGAENSNSVSLGIHAPNIVLDESPLLNPSKYLQLLKILEGTGDYYKTFLFELGNALNRNHFLQNIHYNPNYLVIFIGLEQAIREGRLDPKSVEEKRGMPLFREFYECIFPDEDEIDAQGYRILIPQSQVTDRMRGYTEPSEEDIVSPILGVDVGGGGDLSVFVIRSGDRAWIETTNKSADTMTCVSETERIMAKYGIKPEAVFIDDIGIGRGVTDRLKEKGLMVNAVAVGVNAMDKTRYGNMKAENFWLLKVWLDAGGKLNQNDSWQQLSWIKYKTTTDKVIMIEAKEELKKRTGKSPDFAEALMLTFTKRLAPNVRFI